MINLSKRAARFGLIGSITWDTIKLANGEMWQGPGGILYQAASLCALGYEVMLICKVGEEIWTKINKIISSWTSLKTDAVKIVPGRGNQVYLYYPKKGERKERLKWAVPPLTASDILPFLPHLDFLLVVFNSGYDLDFYSWRQVIHSASCPLWLDLHSLVLSPNFGRRRYESFESWPAWVEGVDYLQANEKEAACLLGQPNRRPSLEEINLLATKGFSLGLRAIFITLGQRGVYVATPEKWAIFQPEKIRKAVDPTGCGDCLAAGTSAELLRGKSPFEAVHFGLSLASQMVEVRGVLSSFELISQFFSDWTEKEKFLSKQD